MALTREKLSKKLSTTSGIKKHQAKELVETFFEEICSLLEQGHHVCLSGLGKFKLRDKKGRPGRNPMTGKEASVSSRRVVTFRAGPKLKRRAEKYNQVAR